MTLSKRGMFFHHLAGALRSGSYAAERLSDWLLCRSIDCYRLSSKYEPAFRLVRPRRAA